MRTEKSGLSCEVCEIFSLFLLIQFHRITTCNRLYCHIWTSRSVPSGRDRVKRKAHIHSILKQWNSKTSRLRSSLRSRCSCAEKRRRVCSPPLHCEVRGLNSASANIVKVPNIYLRPAIKCSTEQAEQFPLAFPFRERVFDTISI